MQNESVHPDGPSTTTESFARARSPNSGTAPRLKDWQEVTTVSQPSSSSYSPSITTQKYSPGSNGMVTNGAADFFSPEIFQIVLHNPTTSHQLLKFSQSRFCGENMEFLDKVGFPRAMDSLRSYNLIADHDLADVRLTVIIPFSTSLQRSCQRSTAPLPLSKLLGS